jgi:hypothetical protein
MSQLQSRKSTARLFCFLYVGASQRIAFKHLPARALHPVQSSEPIAVYLREITLEQCEAHTRRIEDDNPERFKELSDVATDIWYGKAHLSDWPEPILPVHLNILEDELQARGLGKRDPTRQFHVRQILIFHQQWLISYQLFHVAYKALHVSCMSKRNVRY